MERSDAARVAKTVDVMAGEKLLYIFDETDWHSRMPLATVAKNAGYDVTIGLLSDNDSHDDTHGFKIETIKRTHGFGPFSALGLLFGMRKLVRAQTPDIVHTVTLKYAFLLGLALLFVRVKRVYTLAGLGYLFRGEGIRPQLMRALLCAPLMLVLRNARAKIIFQNPDDQQLLITKKYVRAKNTILIRGSGVDLKKFQATPLPYGETPIVLMPTRLVHGKGIGVFVEAAKILKAKGVDAHFQIAGGITRHNPEAISEDEMNFMTADGSVEWLGRVEGMPALLATASLIVYPSYYGEGIPRVLLEAAACGRPIITADSPGCKEAVIVGKNGMLVPIKDAHATAAAIEQLLSDHAMMEFMGSESRKMAEEMFDVHAIVDQTLQVYRQA